MGALVIVIGMIVMIVVHEGAHFVAAKAFNMKATEAFFGFGPRIWSTTRGETEYGVKAIPLGGYVRIVGMNIFEEVPPEEEHRTYRGKPFWQKSVVVLAGIASHFVVAFLIYYLVFTAIGVPRVGLVIDDVLATVDGTVETPASMVGTQVGDVLVSVDGVVLDSWDDFVELAHDRPGMPTTIVVERDGELITLHPTLAAVEDADGEPAGFFGVSPEIETVQSGLVAGFADAASEVGFATSQNVLGLKELVVNFGSFVAAAFGQGDDVLDEARPVSVIGLAQIGNQTARENGIALTLGLVAWVNIFVALLNVAPLYPLDGGHFAVAVWEKIRGQAPDIRKLLPVAAAVFIFIVMIGVLGVYFDIVDPIQLPD